MQQELVGTTNGTNLPTFLSHLTAVYLTTLSNSDIMEQDI
jgi:hypothetical protein